MQILKRNKHVRRLFLLFDYPTRLLSLRCCKQQIVNCASVYPDFPLKRHAVPTTMCVIKMNFFSSSINGVSANQPFSIIERDGMNFACFCSLSRHSSRAVMLNPYRDNLLTCCSYFFFSSLFLSESIRKK